MGLSSDGLMKDRHHAFDDGLPPKLFARKRFARNALTVWAQKTATDVSKGYEIVPTVTLPIAEGALQHRGRGRYELSLASRTDAP